MKHLVIAGVVLALALGSASAFAYDVKQNPTPGYSPADAVLIGCDNGVQNSAYFQAAGVAYGNGGFNLGAGAQISRLQFEHYGWLTLVGPYNYDILVWDEATCTPVGLCPGRQADDAFDTSQVEDEDVCECNLFGAGTVAVTVLAQSCFAPNDCYPDVWWDDQLTNNNLVIDLAAPDCTPTGNGCFLLRIELDMCTTSVEPATWGTVKALYQGD